jgi:hypothetical protein
MDLVYLFISIIFFAVCILYPPTQKTTAYGRG